MKVFLIIFCSLLFSGVCSAGSWTGFYNVSELSQRSTAASGPTDVIVTLDTDVTNTSCGNKALFHLSVDSERNKRNFALVMTAFTAGKKVSLRLSGTCHPWDMSIMDSVKIKY